METYEFFSIFSHFLDNFLGTISPINHYSNNHLTSHLEYNHIIILPIFVVNLVAMATRQHHRVLILGLTNYRRSHDLIFKKL